MKDTKALNITGKIDSITWKTIWRAYQQGYDIAEFISICKELLESKIDPVYFNALQYAINNNYDMVHFMDSWSPNQRASKIWLVGEIHNILKDVPSLRVQLYGGWFGYPLSDLLIDNLDIEYIENIEIDKEAIRMFKRYSDNKGLNENTKPRIIGTVADVRDKNKREKSIDLVINTSSEHMPDLKEIIKDREYRDSNASIKKIPNNMNNGCLFALQSNDMFHIDDHINCVNSENELVEKSGLSDIKFKGSIRMPNGYRRFMVIGYV